MATVFKLPELGENIKTIQVVKVLVAKGDAVAEDQPVLELETDKATVEVPSSVAGTVAEVHVKVGDEITVGHTILTFAEGAAAPEASAAPAPEPEPTTETPVPESPEPTAAAKTPPETEAEPTAEPSGEPSGGGEFALPSLGENIKTIQVVKVLIKAGDRVDQDQPVVELETDKATVEVPSGVAGQVEDVLVKAGDEISVGQPLFRYAGAKAAPKAAASKPETQPEAQPQSRTTPESTPEAPKAAVASTPKAPPAPPPPPPPLPAGGRVPAAPSVRRFAREIGIDVNRVPGGGPTGRVSIEDVKRYAKSLNTERTAAPAAAPAAGFAEEPLPDFSRFGEVSREKMSVIRRKTAEHMARSWALVPHVTIFETADITEIEDLRRRYAERAEKAGGKLTLAAMMVKIVAQALRVFPKFNTSIDMAARELVHKKFINVGVAVDTERGLMVPVIRDADRKNMIQIAVELVQIAEKARTGKITVAELEGGTFTISNLGRTCGTFFTPIVNHPEVAILGVGRAIEEPDPRGGSPRRKLPLSLSFDHRAIDGADGVRFLGWIVEALGEPLVLSLEG